MAANLFFKKVEALRFDDMAGPATHDFFSPFGARRSEKIRKNPKQLSAQRGPGWRLGCF
jgi:hypothetical protein